MAKQVNSTITVVYWQVGKKINEHILNNQRAEYAIEIVSIVSTQLKQVYGKSFEERNLRRMMQFSELFTDIEIVATLSGQLSWSHFVELLPIKSSEARIYYAQKIAEEYWSIRETRKQIEQKAYERCEIANVQVSMGMPELQHTFTTYIAF